MDRIYAQMVVLNFYQKGFVNLMRDLAEIGYCGVEFAGSNYGGMSALELKDLCAELNLDPIGGHVMMPNVLRDLPFLAALGARHVLVPAHYIPDQETAHNVALELNELGRIAMESYGLAVGFHNHTSEFNVVDQCMLMDTLIQETDPQYVTFQLDVGWSNAAGIDSVAYIKRYAGRFSSIHFKENGTVIGPETPVDSAKLPRDAAGNIIRSHEEQQRIEAVARINVPAGQGIVDWKRVRDAADAQGCTAWIVERTWDYEGDIIHCMRADFEYLKTI